MLWQDRHCSDFGSQVAQGRAFLEIDAHPVIVKRFDRCNTCQRDAIVRVGLGFQGFDTEHDVFGGNGFAIGKAGFGTQIVDDPAAIFGVFQRFRDKAVDRIGFVIGPHQKRVIDQAEPLRGFALEDEPVQAIEGLRGKCAAKAHLAALWGIRVHIVEMREVCGVFQLAKGRDAVAFRDVAICQRRGGEGERD